MVRLPRITVMINIALNAFRHIIYYTIFSMGRFSDVVRYDLIRVIATIFNYVSAISYSYCSVNKGYKIPAQRSYP